MNKMQKGFTLIELMIVIAIIAILAAIALPAYQDYVVKSQVAEGSVLADGVKTAVAEFEANTGRWPANNASAGLTMPTSIVGSYVSKVDATGGVIKVNYGGVRANAAIPAGSSIAFSPSTTGGAVSWICRGETAGGNLPPKYLPTSCRQ